MIDLDASHMGTMSDPASMHSMKRMIVRLNAGKASYTARERWSTLKAFCSPSDKSCRVSAGGPPMQVERC